MSFTVTMELITEFLPGLFVAEVDTLGVWDVSFFFDQVFFIGFWREGMH
jgi:hypothetical protein